MMHIGGTYLLLDQQTVCVFLASQLINKNKVDIQYIVYRFTKAEFSNTYLSLADKLFQSLTSKKCGLHVLGPAIQ